MQSEESGARIKTLEKIMQEITSVYELANPIGIRAVEFVNANKELLNVGKKNWENEFKLLKYEGVTQIGTSLKSKVIDQFVWKSDMKKPLLVVVITGGEVSSRSTFDSRVLG